MGAFSLEKIYHVYDDAEGVSIQISPCQDNQDDFITITTLHDENSTEHFGIINLTISKEMARILSIAIKSAADDQTVFQHLSK